MITVLFILKEVMLGEPWGWYSVLKKADLFEAAFWSVMRKGSVGVVILALCCALC